MVDERDVQQLAGHRCDATCADPVRCIVCNRIKRPMGVAVPEELSGMRCDDGCPGYLVDPRPGHRWPAFVPHVVAAPAVLLVGSAAAARGPVELLAWALHQSHPPIRRRRATRPTVTYRLACLLMGDEVDEVVSRLVRAGCTVQQLCRALGSVVLEVSGDPVSIIAEIDRWDGAGSIEIVPPPPPRLRTPPPAG